ncbi:MAG: hypothetical protein AB8G14_15330 [Ilumatobacter sp.]
MSSTSLLRTRWAAVGAAVAVTLGAVGIGSLNIANADVSSGDRPVFISINPCRLVDTRTATNVGPLSAPVGPAATVTIQAHGSNGECTDTSAIPSDAVGLSMNVTAVGPTSNTFLTFWGDGANPGTSNLNPRAGGAPTPNSVSTPLSGTGSFNIYNDRGNTNVVVDVNGYYANHNHDDRYVQIPDEVKVAPSAFVPRNESADYARSAALWLVTGADCFQAPLNLPHGATIGSVTGIASIENANDSVRVRLSRSLLEEGTSSINAQIGDIADTIEQITATNELVHVTAPITGDADPTNGDDAIVDNDTYFYYATVCLTAGHRIWGYTVELS